MNYKLITLFALLFLTGKISSFAQVNVRSSEKIMSSAGKILPEDLEALKNTKTVFAFTKNDNDADKESWRKVFQDVWTITPIEFINYDERNKYMQRPGYSYLTIGAVKLEIQRSSFGYNGSYSSYNSNGGIHVYLCLWMTKTKKNGKDEKITFSRIELFPTAESANTSSSSKDESLDYFYTDCVFYNWYPGLQKHTLKTANDLLKTGDTKFLCENTWDDKALSNLKTETLYMPDYILGEETYRLDITKLMKSYKGKYKLLAAKELNDKILSDDSFYYLTYVKNSNDEFIGIYKSTDGNLIYNVHRGLRITDGDFKDLQKHIDGDK